MTIVGQNYHTRASNTYWALTRIDQSHRVTASIMQTMYFVYRTLEPRIVR